MSHQNHITITGAREHNLRDISLRIPKEQLTVFTGVSGSGKSSIVFGTVAVESQRQLNETFTWFIRNRLPKHEQPDAESIENLSAAIVVDQRPIGGNSRSTVGTMTDIHSTLRVLFSRHGTPSAGPAGAYSFNDPSGMCPGCDGLGRSIRVDLGRVVDPGLSLNQGAIRLPQSQPGTWQWQMVAQSGLFDPDKPVGEYDERERELLLHGRGFSVERPDGRGGTYTNTYEGIVTRFERLYLKRAESSLSERSRAAAAEFVTEGVCPQCDGARLNATALATRINGRGIADYGRMQVSDLVDVLGELTDPSADPGGDPVAAPIARAAERALRRVVDIGLGYLSLDRSTGTLSGGEGQRLKTVRHLGSSLTGMTYIFDEPSIGLHPADVGRLNELLRRLRDKGNTVLVVEHDRDVIDIADHIVDLGPGAGIHGGRVVFEGTVAGLRRADTPTGRALRAIAPLKDSVREAAGWLTVRDAERHNLRRVTARFPLGVLTAVTGVAGSGKSTLVSEFLAVAGADAVVVDQSRIGASARSGPATYTGAMDIIRKMFARQNGVPASLFSFNSRGACGACGGRGEITTDLAFMDPITTRCEECEGRRYRSEVLAHRLHGLSIADVLELTAEEAAKFFATAGDPSLDRKLAALNEVGLGYLTLGRSLSSLSGGERQRLKLANELHRSGTVYLLDEPTTGLHMADVAVLNRLLDRLVDAGNTVVVVEHDLDVIKHADWIIDLGPGGGRDGGRVLFEGTPAQLRDDPDSLTAHHLRADLAR
jgi:excinuclease UvrABC ATPase subunit